MQESLPYNTVVLVRAKPDPGVQALVRRAVERARGSCLIFFHGPAVAMSAGEAEDWSVMTKQLNNRPVKPLELTLSVCSAAWQRHGSERLPSGFSVASLIGFWHAASLARQLISIGQVDEN